MIREFDSMHADLLTLVPKLRYPLPDNESGRALGILSSTIFIDAWVLEDTSATHTLFEWQLLLLTGDHIARIGKFLSREHLSEAQARDQKLRQTNKGGVAAPLVRILSV